MREFTCVVCGTKVIDTSRTQNRMFCSKLCSNRYYEKKRSKPIEAVCKYNDGVLCANHKCDRCGWNPVVEKARKEKLNG